MEELKELRQNAKLSSMADVIGNPINAFHLLRRMSVLWSDLRSVFVQQSNITSKNSVKLSTAKTKPIMREKNKQE